MFTTGELWIDIIVLFSKKQTIFTRFLHISISRQDTYLFIYLFIYLFAYLYIHLCGYIHALSKKKKKSDVALSRKPV